MADILATVQDIEETCNFILLATPAGTSQKAVISLLYDTGLRIEEACELWRFSLGASTFTVQTEKSSLPRTFPLSILPKFYYSYLPYNNAEINRESVCSASTVKRAVLSYSNKLYYKEQKNIMSNIFRYRVARVMQAEGKTLAEIQQFLGHSSPLSTMSYLSAIYWGRDMHL